MASLVLNLGFLLSFVGSPNIRQQPHWALLFLSIRDLLVTLVLIPSAIDWFVTNFGMWSGGMIWCKTAGFLDFALAFEYPLLLLAIAFILYTRRHGPPEGLDLPMGGMDEVDQFNDAHEQSMPLGGGGQQHRQGSRPPSVANSFSTPQHNGERPSFFKTPPKPPSVVGSVDGYRYRHRFLDMSPRLKDGAPFSFESIPARTGTRKEVREASAGSRSTSLPTGRGR